MAGVNWESHRCLAAAGREIGAAGGRSVKAGVFPNPELSAELDNAFGSKAKRNLESAETALQVSQLFELGGKRDARHAVAAAEIDALRWDRAATRLQVLAETAEAFAKTLDAQRRVSELEEQVDDLDRLTPPLRRRVEAGASSSAEISRGRLARAGGCAPFRACDLSRLLAHGSARRSANAQPSPSSRG